MVRLDRALRLFVLATILLTGLPAHPVGAVDPDPQAEAIATGINDFLVVINQLGSFPELSEPVPFTNLSLAADEALRLSELFQDSLQATLNQASALASLDSIRHAIDNADGTDNGIAVLFDNVSVAPNSSNSDKIDITFSISATRTTATPFAFSSGSLNLNGGVLNLDLALSTALHFQLNTTELDANPSNAFYTVGEPQLLISAAISETINSFKGHLGFTELAISGDALLNLASTIDVQDPDNNGVITQDEFLSTAPEDLFAFAYVDKQSPAVDVLVNIDTSLTPSINPDGTIELNDTTLSDGLDAPQVDISAIDDLANIKPAEVLSGLSHAVGGLLSAQGLGELKLPFLKQNVSDVVLFAQPLMDVVRQQGDAAILCGTNDTDPPTIDPALLPTTTTYYCQAIAVTAATTATWTIANGTAGGNTDGADALNTVGTNPSDNAEFTVAAGEQPQVSLTFVDSDGATHTVKPLFGSAQELLTNLAELGGVDTSVPDTLVWDPANSTLTYHLVKSFDPISTTGTLNFGDQLASDTGLIGLSPDSSANVTLEASNTQLDISFGIILVDNINDIVPGGTLADRFFIKVRNGANEYEFSTDIAVSADISLQGKLGFLEVSAVGDPDLQNALAILPKTSAEPMLGVNIEAPGIAIAGKPPVADAILLTELISPTTSYVTPTINAKVEGGLLVSAALGDPPTPIASGGVAISWPDITIGAPAATTDPDFDASLAAFNINPQDPLALLSIILDNLDTLANQIDAISSGAVGNALDTRLPMVNVSPRELLAQFDNLKAAIDEIRLGTPDAAIACGTQNSDPPAGDLNGAAPGTIIYCQAGSDETPEAGSVVWSINGGTPMTNTTSLATVGPNPSANAAFMVSEPGGLGSFSVSVEFVDSMGSHSAEIPAATPPSSLQQLERILESKLGLPGSALAFEMIDLPAPGVTAGDGVQDLVIRLGYGICTEGFDSCSDNGNHRVVPATQAPIRINLGGTRPELAGLSTNSSFVINYSAQAQLDLGILLANTPQVVVIDTSHIELEAAVETDNLNLQANIGPLEITLGTGVNGASDPVGQALLSSRFALTKSDIDGTDGNETFTIGAFAGGLSPSLDGPAVPNACGTISGKDTSGNDVNDVPLSGDGCARLSLGLGNEYLGDMGFVVADINDPLGAEVIVPANLEDRIADALLDWDLILQALEQLLGQLNQSLDGAASNTNIPLIGPVLDGGAEVAGHLQTAVNSLADLNDQLNNVADTDGDGVNAMDVDATIRSEIAAALGSAPNPLLLDRDGDSDRDRDNDDIRVILTCGASDCTAANQVDDIDDVRVTFYIGQGVAGLNDPQQGCSADCESGLEVPFNIGLPGLPLRFQGALHADAGWKLLVDFGLSRNEGPYLVTDGDGHGADPELSVGASVGLAESVANCVGDPGITDPAASGELADTRWAENRCLRGELGFLQITARDGASPGGDSTNDDPTNLSLLTRLNLTSSSGSRLTYADLVGGSAGIDLDLDASANVDLRFRTGLLEGQSAGFPSVIGTFHLEWTLPFTPTEVRFDNLHLDAGSLATQMIEPLVEEIQNVTKPLQPVIDTVRAPLPVASDLSRMVGGDPISLFDIMKNATGAELDLIESILGFVGFVNGYDPSAANVLIPLGNSPGSFSVNVGQALEGPLTPDRAGELVDTENSNSRANLLADENIGGGDNPDSAFGVPGLSFPVLNDSSNIFKLLMGQDVILVHYDAGTLRASAGLSYSFGPIFIGPIPVSIMVGGSAAIEGRFAIGYDTSGLRQVLEGASGEHLFDGIFINDLNVQGLDVPELKLIGTISVAAAVDALVVSAGVQGGIRLTVNFDLDDRPEPDGKLRIHEIFNKLHNPICLFVVSGNLSAFLAAFVKVELLFYSKTWRFNIADIVLLDFSTACDPPQPNLADVVDGNLVLNVGARANLRGIVTDEPDEKVIVRQLNSQGTQFSISAFGIQETETISDGGQIIANAGAGKDVISLEAGVDSQDNAIFFTASAVISGGGDDDQIRTGDGNDSISGGAGNDKISSGAGDDTIHGNADDDVLAGEIGTDHIYGHDGHDALSGGPHDDYLDGGIGNDELVGGPGTNSASGPGPNPDEGDTLIGAAGDDNLDGEFGHDWLYGDEVLTCDANGATAAPNADQLTGGEGDDHLFGGAGPDRLIGEEGNDALCGNDGDDFLDGDDDIADSADGNDTLDGGDNADELYGRSGNDRLFGKAHTDTLVGGDDDDDLSGGQGGDTLEGGPGDDYLFGDDGSVNPDRTSVEFAESAAGHGIDIMRGDDGADVMYGEGNHDEMYGDADNDYMEGNAGGDTMRGGTADDTMFGKADGDTMFGDSGRDTMFGNLNNDVMRGGIGDDTMEGNQDNDEMYGDAGDDSMEGNENSDTMFGGAGQDDMIGGTSQPSISDDADYLYGGNDSSDLASDHDVLVGDNATIVRSLDGDGNWIHDSFSSSAQQVGRRVITLHDVATTNSTPAAGASGPDELYGEAGYDIMYGQGDHDKMFGGSADDYMEGNAGVDAMHGEAGNDDMVGGTGRINNDPATGTDGRFDAGDLMYGGPDFDVMAGDNALLVRVLDNGQWVKNTFNDGLQHEPRILLDIDSPDTNLVSGDDTMFGDDHDDLMYGQGGGDTMDGGNGDDFMEGNAASDVMTGHAGQDDMIGGSVEAGLTDVNDIMFGGADQDVMLGDNGKIHRPTDSANAGSWISDINTHAVVRNIQLHGVELVGGASNAAASGADYMEGQGEHDQLFGQGKGDTLRGGDSPDYLEGNHGADTLYGDADEDDLIGGGSANDGVIDDDRIGTSLLDGGDTLYGDDGNLNSLTGDDGDVLAGDNARISRASDHTTPWQLDPNVNDVVRDIVLFDVQTLGGPAISLDVSGGDRIFGEGGRDLAFGQGNGSQLATQSDPPDGRDNDRDGRESASSVGYDCLDGADNDGDGLSDLADSGCFTQTDEDAVWSGDEISGGPGDDHLEGNHGNDWMFGNDDEDDVHGGSSAGIDPSVGGSHIGGPPPTNLLDGDDIMSGNEEDDLMVGDNGRIVRVTDDAGIWLRLTGGLGPFDLVRRVTTMAQTPESSGAFGNDYMLSGQGHDESYGQLGHDYMEGNEGEDAMVGDLGQVTSNVEDGSREEFIRPNEPFISDTIFEAGTLHRQVELFAFSLDQGAAGNDTLLGGDDHDSMHGGPGVDIMNGNGDEDWLFGGDSNDVIWGGRGHDHLWGGNHADYLDVKPRPASATFLVADPPEWFTYGREENYDDIDYIYGGWHQDAMQANVGDEGPKPGDRLIDWAGIFNVYYLCPGLYGEYIITRDLSPSVMDFLLSLSEGNGLVDPRTAGTSGFNEIGMVYRPHDINDNANPPHPDSPGHFTCN